MNQKLADKGLLEGQVRIPSGCAISAIMDKSGKRHNGLDIIKSIALMHDRGNGLGGGFAAYGIYPEYAELYAFHIFLDSRESRLKVQDYLEEMFTIEATGKLPTTKVASVKNPPIIWRYFVSPRAEKVEEFAEGDEEQFVMDCVMHINSRIDGAFVASSGKNMGAFKGVGYPEDLGEFYKLQDYKAWLWTAHARFPTNTPGWWGGAHPFTLLNWSIVHNGEISSYDANRRYIEQFGYDCSLQTDTEAITYLFDLLVRRHGLSLNMAAHILCAPSWDEIDRMSPQDQAYETAIREVYGPALVNGPFSVILGTGKGLLALNDRLKLRALMMGEKDDMVYFASEEAAIRIICKDVENVRAVEGGVPVIVRLNGEEAGTSNTKGGANND